MASSMTITVTVLHHETFERWCETCLVTTTWVRVFMRIGKSDGSVFIRCLKHEGIYGHD